MLTIRDEQWEVFERDANERFVEQLVDTLQAAWPEACAGLDRKQVRGRVVAALKAAQDLGFAKRENLTRYLHVAFQQGDPEFATSDAAPWAATILGWEAEPAAKLDALEEAAARAVEAEGA